MAPWQGWHYQAQLSVPDVDCAWAGLEDDGVGEFLKGVRGGCMAGPRKNCRLAAIMAVDVVGYCGLVGADEVRTLARVRAHLVELVEPLIAEYHGRVVKRTGDGALVEFGSTVDAVECAVAIQNGMAEREAARPEDQRVRYRIGINMGEIVLEDGDIFGNVVNVAARLQEVAEAGGICVSASVQEQVRTKIALGFHDLGERRLKNIAAPVCVYRTASTPSSSSAAVPTIDKPAIAVLPFENLSGDPEQQYFSDGITEDIITELSRFRSLSVIARISAVALRTRPIKVQDIARELGVAYVVEGSVRRAAERLRITAQLVDVKTGKHLWAERYDRELELRKVFDLQDEVARAVASTISSRVDAVGRHRAEHLSPTELTAYDLVLRAKDLTSKYTRADNEKALACAEGAVELDSTSARAHAHAAWCHFFNYMACWTADRENALAKAYELAQRAVMLDETDSFAHCILGAVHWFRREYDEARSEIKIAIDLNPNDPEARRYYGNLLAATGNPDAGIEQIDLGKRLNPFDTRWVPWIRGIACFTARRYDEAIAALRQAHDPINEVRGWLAASYAHAGRVEEAKAMLEKFLRTADSDMAAFPGHRLKDWESYWHGAFEYRDQKDFDHLFDALRKAGMPE
jgi:adenylate cyclase